LVKDYSIVHFNHQVNEEVYSPAYPAYDCEPVVQPVTYDAFYFPNYFSPPSYLRDSYDEEVQARLEDWRIDVMTGSGNIDHNNIEINNFCADTSTLLKSTIQMFIQRKISNS